jgi:hypothetical protein
MLSVLLLYGSIAKLFFDCLKPFVFISLGKPNTLIVAMCFLNVQS